jgi:hypothetical protein
MSKLVAALGLSLSLSLAACSSGGPGEEPGPDVGAEPGPAGRMVSLHVTVPAALGEVANGSLDDSYASGASIFLAQVQETADGVLLVAGPGKKDGAEYTILMPHAIAAPVTGGETLAVETTLAKVYVPVLGAGKPLELDGATLTNLVLGGQEGDAVRPVLSGTISGTATRAGANQVQSDMVGGGLGDFLMNAGFEGTDLDGDGKSDEWNVVADFTTETVTVK